MSAALACPSHSSHFARQIDSLLFRQGREIQHRAWDRPRHFAPLSVSGSVEYRLKLHIFHTTNLLDLALLRATGLCLGCCRRFSLYTFIFGGVYDGLDERCLAVVLRKALTCAKTTYS